MQGIDWPSKVRAPPEQEPEHAANASAGEAGAPASGSAEGQSSREETPPRLRARVNEMSHVDRTGVRDAWAVAYLKAFPQIRQDAGSYRDALKSVKAYWRALEPQYRRDWAKHHLDASSPCPAFPTVAKYMAWRAGQAGPVVVYDPDFAGAQSEGAQAQVADEFGGESRVHGYVLTWNGRWGARRADASKIMHATSLPLGAVVEMVRACPFYNRLWDAFKTFALQVRMALDWPLVSGTMEISYHRKNAENLIHFHLSVTDPKRRHRLRDGVMWAFLGSKPDVRPTQGKGRHLAKALSTAHYYVQAPKLGTVFTFTNYKAHEVLMVEPAAIYELWRKRKLTHGLCKHELMLSRGRGVRNMIAEVEYHERWEQSQRQAAQRAILQALIQWKPNKEIQVVIDWMELHKNRFGSATRFPFLVLTGPSRYGKTSYAKNLYGSDVTLVLSCQGAVAPALDQMRPFHRCVVCDEASHDLVCSNKQVFQAGLDTVQLGQSQCNQHAYQTFLYAMPLIICTNDWLVDATEDQVEWCNANSVVVNVQECMWRDDVPLMDA